MANKRIQDLAPAASVALTDLIEISDGSATSKKAEISQVQSTITSGFVPSSRTISTTSPLAGGGDLSANRTFSIADAAADGATKGAAAFASNDFNSAAGVISIDYTNGQKATAAQPGFLTAADWTTFNNKQNALGFTPPPNTRLINTTSPLAGGGDLTADRTLSIADAAADGATKGAATFAATDFNSAAGVISIDYTNGQAASAANKGFLTAADWTTFNSKQDALPVADTTAIVKGSADATKLLRFEVDGFTTGTTRVATPPNQNFTMAGIDVAQTFSVTQTFTPAANNRAINISAATLSGASGLEFIRVSGTWNTSGTPAAMLVDITDVVSNAASKLADFQISSSSVFSIGKTGALNFLDDVRQTFNPGANNSGLNTGSVAADPGGLSNGDIWYQSTANELRARINGATVALGAAGSSPPFDDGTSIIKGSADATKLLRFEVDGFTTGTTRVITPPNSNLTLAGIDIANAWSDGVTQTFNPNGTSVGINVGSHTADPSVLNNGDLWYQSTANELRARINGATVSLVAGIPPFVDSTAIIKGSADATKLLRIEVDGFTTGTTRVATPPNQDFTIAGLEVQQTFTKRQTITPPVDTGALVVSGYSQTGSAAANLMDLSGTWNTAGAPNGIKLNITNTASDATALLMDLQANSGSRFSVDINGFATVGDGLLVGTTFNIGSVFAINSTGLATWADGVRQTFNPNGTNAGINVGSHTADPSAPSNGDLWYQSTANELRARINGATVALGAGGSSPPFTDTTAIVKGSADATKLLRFEVDGFTTGTTRVATPPNQDFTIAGIDVQQTFTQRQTITPPANTAALVVSGASLTGASTTTFLDFSGTWNTSGITTAFKLNITDTASNSDSLLMDLQVGGNGKFTIGKGGDVVAAAGAFVVNTTGNIAVFSQLTFVQSGISITDASGDIAFSAPIKLNNAAQAETPTATHTLIVRDSNGTEYRLLCLPV